MHNPLVNNLDNLSINELEQKIFELQRKYFQTHNPSVQLQITNFLEIYKNELHTRRAIETQRMRDQENDNNSLDSLIKVS